MTSLRSEDSGIENGNVRRPSAVSFSHDPEGISAPIGRELSHGTNNQFASSNNNNNNNNKNNNSGDSPNHSIISKDGINYHGAAATSSNHGGTNSPSRSRRTVLREIIAAVRANREILVDSFLKTSAAYSVAAAAASGTPPQSSVSGTNNNQSPHNNKDSDEGPHDEYPLWIPSFYSSPDHRLPAQRVVTANKPNAMRNRALAAMAIALSTLEIEMNEGTPLSASQNIGGAAHATDNVNLPTALQNSPQATSKASQALAMCPTSPVMPSDEQHPNKPTRRLAPITVEDVIINGRVPLDLLSQSMITLFEAQDIFQKCIAANPVLEGKFEVKVAPASVLLVDTEDDWGTNFEVAPRRLAYKASELEEALSDVLRRRGVAICFFDKKALLEGMKQDDAGGEDEDDDDESNPAKKNLHALLNAPLNEDGSFANEDEGANAHSVGNLFNGSFTGIGGGRGAPVAMQALRTRRTDIREADCGFVLGPTRQAESVALAVTKWNRERDELELVYTEVTATALLDAMAMRNVKTGRPRGFVALMPLQELTINVPESSKNVSNNSPSQSSAQSPQDACFSISISNNAASSGSGPGISALEVVASSAVTHDCIFPAFATLAQYHADEIEANAAAISAMDKKTTVRIPLGHIDHSIATHVTCCAVGSALISGTLDKGLPINEIVNTVNMSDVHMSIESDDTLHVHEVFSYMLQYSLKTQAAQLDVEWCPVVQLVHRANAAATVSVEQLCETLQQVRNASNITEDNLSASLKKPMDVSMIVKVRIDIAIGTHGNSLNGTSGGTRWLVVCGYDEDTSMVHVLDPAPKRFGLFWSVSVEQLHRALTGHGYIILANKRSSVGKSAADFIVARPETNQICLQAGISYDSPDLILPTHSQLPPRPIARCPLSLAACAISRISNRNVTFSQFLRSLPHPAPYGFTEDISLAHFAHVTRTFCHEENLRVKMTLCHLSVDAQGVRAVDENQFSQRLAAAAASPQHAVIVNYSVAGFTSCVRADRGTGSFALLLGFIPQDGKYNRYDRVLLQDCSDFTSQQVFSVEVNELYRACCDVCSVSRRTMGFIDLRYVEETEMLSPVGSLQSVPSVGDCVSVPSGAMSVVSANREQNVSIALEGTLATSNWEAIAVSNHPELPRHMFKSPAIPVFTATSAALVSLGVVCAESDIVAANFGKSAENTKYEYLPTVLQAKPPTLSVAREMIEKYLAASSANNAAGTGLTLLAAEKTNLLTALQAMAKHPRDVRVILQYDCRVVHSTIRKFVSAGVVSAVKGSGEGAFIRVLEAETASFLDVWEAKALSLMKTFDGQQQQGSGVDSSSSSSVPITGVLVLYRPGQVDEALFSTQPPNVTVGNNSSTAAGSQAPRPPAINPSMNESAIGGGNLITSPPASPLLHHRPSQQEGGAAGSMRSKAMPYSLSASGKK